LPEIRQDSMKDREPTAEELRDWMQRYLAEKLTGRDLGARIPASQHPQLMTPGERWRQRLGRLPWGKPQPEEQQQPFSPEAVSEPATTIFVRSERVDRPAQQQQPFSRRRKRPDAS
jgi:hypothetical protein